MSGISRDIDTAAGDLVPSQTTVFANGDVAPSLVIVNDDDVVSHSPCPFPPSHCDATMIAGSNNVFIGPSVVFTNDLYPKVEEWDESMIVKTHIRNNVSLGANSTIIAGVEIGEYTLIGAGSVVTKNISKNSIAFGNPAKIKSKNYRKE